ncbi:hypothetical protein EUGRSUZ_J02543 [Eucalyptus grandis]|uniref:Uncharacterized protein n=2 Tax=Eucalyptus grandis TaxID=71139 RepID=A0ACC3J921_EUCGR|nr:hypothetical protein EUGRSUZ_J02543 [Eucalyptus grandis]
MPSQMKIHVSIECDGSLNKKDEHAPSEIDGKLDTNRINDESQSKLKVPCWIRKTHESGKRNDSPDRKDEHVSSEKEDRHGNSRSGDQGDFYLKTLSKRKKSCESGQSNGGLGKKEHHVISENEGGPDNSVGNDDAWMNLEKPAGGGTPGCWIGKLFVSNTEIAKGKNDQNFMYLALERCACSLDDLIRAHSNSSEKSVFPDDLASNAIIEYRIRLDSVKGTTQDVNLWREDGHPSPLLLKLMRDVISGLVHLHHLGIIHRDLKPQSVLITKELCAKLSDMGSSQRLPKDTSPSGYHVPNCGTLALHTPEQLSPAHQMCSVDLFGLGCILFFCITGGKHPFGDGLKGDNNIKEYSIDLSPVEFLPEAADLFARLLNPNPNLRCNDRTILNRKCH